MKLSGLAKTCEQVEGGASEQARLRILAALFRRLDSKTLEAVAHFTAGEAVDPRHAETLGIGPAMIRAAIADLSGRQLDEIDSEIRKTGDISEAAAALGGRDDLTVDELWKKINSTVSRNQDRAALLRYVFSHTTGRGAKYFVRIVLGQMRIGAGLGTILRAIAKAFEVDPQLVERVYTLTNDIGLAARRAARGERALLRTGLTLFRPCQFMNAQRVKDAGEVFNRLPATGIRFEVKYDGARLQIHIRGGRPREVKLYSRRLNDDTAAMPDLVEAITEAWKGGDAIIEGEAVAFDATLSMKQPFQAVLTRLGRKYDIEEKAHEIPLVLYLFEMIYQDGEDLMPLPQSERRRRLATLVGETARVKMSEGIETDSPRDEEQFFKKALEAGHEGLMAKDPAAPYLPGRRTDNWMKIKPEFETLDVVVVGAVWGSGRRRGTLSSLLVAVRDDGSLRTVGKVGTGFSDETLREITSKLEPAVIASHGHQVEVEPGMVIEVDFQDIQKTGAYSSGYALRIPRFKRERTDKSVREADSLVRLEQLYRQVHG